MPKGPSVQQYEDYYYNAPSIIDLKNECPTCGSTLFISPYCANIGFEMIEWNVECSNESCDYEAMVGLPDLNSLQQQGFMIDDTTENGDIAPEYWYASEWKHNK